MSGRWTAFATAMAALFLTAPAGAQPIASATGIYVVVGFRAASNVASTRAMQEANSRQDLVGLTIDFDNLQSWLDGSLCGAGTLRESAEASIWLDEPNLSDLQVNPGPGDARANAEMIVDCGGAARSTIKRLLVVDPRVLVTVSDDGSTYFILEKPLGTDGGMTFERGLQTKGFDPGLVDGLIDESTRAAVAQLADTLGAGFRFQPGIITANLLEFVVR